LLHALGLKKSEEQINQTLLDSWDRKERNLADELESLKDAIADIQTRIRAKSAALDRTKDVETRAIVEREIQVLFHELDVKKPRQDLLFSGMTRISSELESLRKLNTARLAATDANQIRELQLQMKIALTNLDEVEHETQKLVVIDRKPGVTNPPMDTARLAAITGQTVATTVAPAATQAAPSLLSEADKQRLARIVEDAN